MNDSPQTLLTPALEGSTFELTVSFRTNTGENATPKSASYSLFTPDGQVVNGRSNVAFPVLAPDVVLTLSGDDLALSGGAPAESRVVVVGAVFDTPRQNDCQYYQEIWFTVKRRMGA